MRVLNQSANKKPQYLPQIPLIYADETQKQQKQQQPSPNCLSLRDNAACCVPLRHLRYLRENKHASVLNQSTQKKPQCLPQISQIYADKTQNNKTALTSPTCLSLRNNAACCIRLRDLRYLRENKHASVLNQSTQKKPQCLPLISLIYADETHNNKL